MLTRNEVLQAVIDGNSKKVQRSYYADHGDVRSWADPEGDHTVICWLASDGDQFNPDHWRLKPPEPVQVPLGPMDIPAVCWVRPKDATWADGCERLVMWVQIDEIWVLEQANDGAPQFAAYSYCYAANHFLYSADWITWKPMSKEAP